MLSAPGWAEHAHYMGSPDGSPIDQATLTVQDHPMHIAMESLIWQEELDGAIHALGSEPGVKNYKIGRASGRERGRQDGYICAVDGALTKKISQTTKRKRT